MNKETVDFKEIIGSQFDVDWWVKQNECSQEALDYLVKWSEKNPVTIYQHLLRVEKEPTGNKCSWGQLQTGIVALVPEYKCKLKLDIYYQ